MSNDKWSTFVGWGEVHKVVNKAVKLSAKQGLVHVLCGEHEVN